MAACDQVVWWIAESAPEPIVAIGSLSETDAFAEQAGFARPCSCALTQGTGSADQNDRSDWRTVDCPDLQQPRLVSLGASRRAGGSSRVCHRVPIMFGDRRR